MGVGIMSLDLKDVRIWFYSRNLSDSFSSSNSSSPVSNGGGPEALKHWAIVLDYMSVTRPGIVNYRILYEANNVEGQLVARWAPHGIDQEEEWQNYGGFEKKSDDKIVQINEDRAKQYCDDFNQLRIKYVAIRDNCQRFASEFLANVLMDSNIALPPTINEVKTGILAALEVSLRSVSNLGYRVLNDSKIGQGAVEVAVMETIQRVNSNGLQHIQSLSQSPIKEFLDHHGKKIALTAFGEVTESIMNASGGAFSWYNLLQIPVELIVGQIMQKKGFTDLQAYGGKKLASCLTTTGVGVLVGGPVGCLVSVVVWLAAEIVATFTRLLLAKTFGKTIFGESDSVNLLKSIYTYFKMKLDGGMDASLQWMQDYIAQFQKKKLV